MTGGYLRQEENQYFACERERVVELPVKFMGYALVRTFIGGLEMNDPMKVIDPKAESFGDLWQIAIYCGAVVVSVACLRDLDVTLYLPSQASIVSVTG